MFVIVLAMVLAVALGGLVVGFVAVEARRDGREVLTPEGEDLLAGARRRHEHLRERGQRAARRTLHGAARK